jgi:HlyD family secretion protein
MIRISRRSLVVAAAGIAAAAAAAYLWRPLPVPVDTGRVSRGPLVVTLDEEGETRVRERVVVAAPVTGHLLRIRLDEGQAVAAGAVVARLEPLPLDPRSREQAAAQLKSAEATARETGARARAARAELDQARKTLARSELLAAAGRLATQDLEQARTAERTAVQELAAAAFRSQAAAADASNARAALIGAAGANRVFEVRAPVAGKVLRVIEESERVVPAGAPLIEIGDPASLEVQVDLLSADAVSVPPGANVLLAGWGGNRELKARVRVVEPSGFIKVSPLGVEEHRVHVIADFVDPPGQLGDRYRVEARVVVWEGREVLKVPAGALFRDGDGWSAFVASGGRAHLRRLRTGHRNPSDVEVVQGLAVGETVILHPGDRVKDGIRIAAR